MENPHHMIISCREKMTSILSMIDLKKSTMRLEEIDSKISLSDIWSDHKQASLLMKERQKISDFINKYNYFMDQVSFYEELSRELPKDFEDQKHEICKLHEEISDLEFKQMMTDPVADNPAILTISAGAGGLEAANWTTMLARMYLRWADSYKFNVEILDENPSEEHSSICTDSITFRISGPYAYGYLKGESGVHRLIRNSPFNADNARHTSFAAVAVSPDIEDKIDIKINDKDIDVTAQTSTGKGGQNVNRIKSAIRLRHFPTGINILVRAERDQLSNKKTAFKMLKAKLYEIEEKKRQSEQDRLIESQMQNKFGSQIRTYTLNPYTLVKDHRTECESINSQSVLDGNIQEFILSNLKHLSQ